MDPLSVYITSIAVMARGMAVLKCSLRKYMVTYNTVIKKHFIYDTIPLVITWAIMRMQNEGR